MRALVRPSVILLAAYAIALHTVLWAVVAPLIPAPAVDPFTVICHGETSAPTAQAPTPGSLLPGHACDHCNLCNGATPPLPPDTMLANRFEPARTLHVLRPINVARYFGRPQARPRPSGFRLTQSLPRPASFNPSSRYGNFPCCKMHML
jgi:hypothetical protein